ncbi:unnamed protein product [Phaedon cochleariae]|uniref:Uncharacterized protein n=1 Tax=Phaedon cochleariae TaxID=80249 RepID=A0A9P0GVB6_PHACE|nr:unnamed protein product [Phaedon cochleariae]
MTKLKESIVLKMQNLFCLSFFLGITSIFAQLDGSKYNVAMKEYSKALHDECVKQHKVTDDDIWKVRTGIFDDNNHEMKNYILCLWRESGSMDLSTFRLSKILLDVYMPEEVHKGDGTNMYLECAGKGRELPAGTALQDRIWVFMKCAQQADPVNFVMF